MTAGKMHVDHQPMGFWDPSVIVGDARRNGVRVLPVDLAQSALTCRLPGCLS
jgi:error-prone DNA polymerase